METATAQLREELFDTLRQLKAGKIDAATAQAVSKISGNIINSVAIEIQAAHIIGSDRISSLNGVPVRELAGGVVHRLEG